MNPLTGLSVARILLGSLALIAPGLATKLFGLDPEQRQLTFMNRMFGSREIVLGVVTLAAPPALQRPIVAMGVAVDAADAAAGVLATRSGVVAPRAGIGLAAPALAAVGVGVAALVNAKR